MKDAILVTATDTGVGKTTVTAGLIRAMRMRGFSAAGMKPFTTGCPLRGDKLISEDAEIISEACEYEIERELLAPVLFAEPLAPAAAARVNGKTVNIQAAIDAFNAICEKYDFVIVEGIGGLAVPLSDEMTVADFAKACGLDLVIVARRTLGTLNHTALTVEYARSKGLGIRGIILTGPPPDADDVSAPTNRSELERLTGIPVVATIPAIEPPVEIDDVIGAARANLAPERVINL